MKKYVSLQCSTCARKKDELIDLTHYAPDRCTITLGCEGRLSPVGYTSDGTTILGVPPTGLSNWYPRGTTTTTNKAIKADSLYDTSTGSKQQIVLAVSNDAMGFTPSSAAKVILRLNAEQQTAKDYRQYTYRRSSPFTVINGVEDNQAKKVLRYNITGATPDQVEVYLNGVKRDRYTDYDLHDGTIGSPVPPNSVLFTSMVTGASNQVDVIVTKAAAVTNTELTFTRAIDDESRAGTGAWEGIDAVKSAGLGQYSLFYCDFAEISATLALDIKLRVADAVLVDIPSGPEYAVQLAAFLVSRSKLHTQVDRQRAKWIPINGLNTNTDYLVIKMVDGVRSMLVTEASAKDLFPVLDVVRFGTPKLQTTNLLGDDDAAELDNTIINGPDA